jgi:succinate CoA transferase
MTVIHKFPKLTAAEAAKLIAHKETVAFSGFTAAGAAKAVPMAIADRAKQIHNKGDEYWLRVITGASTGKTIDDRLAEEDVIAWRAPFQSSKKLREQINSQKVRFVDMHLSHLPQMVSNGFLGKIDHAVIEATEVTPDGRVYLTSSIGASPTFLKYADKVIIEVNHHHSVRTREMADIITVPPPPNRDPIQIHDPMCRVGYPYAVVDPKKVIGIVENNEPDHVNPFIEPGDHCEKIAKHVLEFLLKENDRGIIPKDFLPLQAGVGNLANTVMLSLGASEDIPPFYMYSEVFQDSLVSLMESGSLLGASSCSLTLSPDMLKKVYNNMDFFVPRIVLRPQEISNNPGIIRRLGVIAINTALEVDIYGNVNSTHVCGTDIVNGIGGSGDFNRNAYLSIDMCPSITRNGKISTVVPMCSHIDNTEHSVQVIVTEQGLADLRGLGPRQRAEKIIENCAHPMYRETLHKYLRSSKSGHLPHNLDSCFTLHQNLQQYGTMLPESS